MPDYALNRLSSRSFEHLVQSLAVKILGAGITIFGDGPDGGREATFEGKVLYPSGADPWDGYGVVQVKFLQRPSGTRKDGDWAVEQLKDELAKFANADRGLRQPDYFVYVTNAVLTPVHERGSKDRARQLLEDFKTNTSLKGYRIWDYDQICRFLDADIDVRTAYAPLITPGDVLSAVIRQFHTSLADLEDTLVNFLQKELLTDQFVNLDQAGHSTEESIPLARVFVDLPTVGEPDAGRMRLYQHSDDLPGDDEDSLEDGFIKQILTAASERFDIVTSGVTEAVQPLESAVSQDMHGRFVLIGGPGQGKTTLGQFICQIFRAAIISPMPPQSLSREICTALAIIQEHCKNEGIDIEDEVVPRFPFRLSLSDFASALSNRSETGVNSVFSYLAWQITRRTEKHIRADDVQRFLAHYPSVVIFDGLDEVPASSNREQVLDTIRDFWVDATRLNADILCIATSRPQGYNEDFSPRYYRHRRLAELSPELGMRFARRLADVRYGTNVDRKETVLARLERAFEHESTARLMRSPLQVTIMTALVDRRGQPPQARWNLFRSYYEVIYQREEEKNIPASTILRDYSSEIDALHHQVGLLLQIASEKTGGTNAKLARQRFRALVEAQLKEEGHEGETLRELSQQIVDAVAERLVLLVELEEEQIGFEIRSLQEFMAAQSLMEGSDREIQVRLEEIAPIQFWRNAFLFAAGQCFSHRRNFRDTIYSICAGLNELESDPISVACLAGSDLAVALLDEGLTLRRPKYARMIARVAVRCLDVVNPDLQARFARVYEPQLEQLYQDEIKSRIDSGSGVSFFGAWNCLLRLVLDGLPWALQMADDNWPEERERQLQIIGATHELMNNPWVVQKIVGLLPLVPLKNLRSVLVHSYGLPRRGTVSLGSVNETAFEVLTPYYPMHEIKLLGSTVRYGNVVRLKGPQSGHIKRFKNINDWHSSWTVYKAAGEFMDDPTKESLASSLHSIAESFVGNWEDLFASEPLVLPWPLLACLSACNSSTELLAIAAKAQRGDFGDVGDWEAAENRWNANGVTKEDLRSMTVDRLPFDRAIKDIGFPTTLRAMPVLISPFESDEPIDDLLDIFRFVSDGATKGFVASAINWSLIATSVYGEPDQARVLPTIDLDTLKSIYGLVPADSLIPGDVLIRTLDTLGHDILDLLGGLKNVNFQFGFYGAQGTRLGQVSELLRQTYIRRDGDVNLLPILAKAAEQGVFSSQGLEVQKPEGFETYELKSAALVINLAQESWETDSAGEWIMISRDVAKSNHHVYRQIITTFENNGAVGHFVEKYLSGLGRQIPSDDIQSHREHINLLEDILSKRTSRFNDLALSSEFNLPSRIVRPITG